MLMKMQMIARNAKKRADIKKNVGEKYRADNCARYAKRANDGLNEQQRERE